MYSLFKFKFFRNLGKANDILVRQVLPNERDWQLKFFCNLPHWMTSREYCSHRTCIGIQSVQSLFVHTANVCISLQHETMKFTTLVLVKATIFFGASSLNSHAWFAKVWHLICNLQHQLILFCYITYIWFSCYFIWIDFIGQTQTWLHAHVCVRNSSAYLFGGSAGWLCTQLSTPLPP